MAPGSVAPPPGGASGPSSEAPTESEQTALVLDSDPLGRLLAVSAASALGLRVHSAPHEACRDGATPHMAVVVFFPLALTADCRASCAAARARAVVNTAPPLVVGYGAGPAGLLAAHRVHGCVDLVLLLTVAGGCARFAHLPAVDDVAAAGLTPREADVLVLLLGGLTTPQIAGRLCVSSSTARTHCRAVLRKLAVRDRGALRARLLAGRSAGLLAGAGPSSEVCLGGHASSAEE